MNAKKKNKKANKPPNPNPPQNVKSAPKKEEKDEELTPKCEVKEEILQPVCSEVAEMPVISSEVKEIESETPKKPKRNKGKNKIQDKEEKIDVEEKMPEVQVEPLPKLEELIVTVPVDEKKSEAKTDPLDEAIVPSARKKKNKKKTQEQPKEESKTLSEESKTRTDNNDTILPSKLATGIIEKVDTEIQELFSSKPETPKIEGNKKKNKKKNRTDSEKSDNVSCTSAFQNILVEDTSKLEQSDLGVEAIESVCDLGTGKSENVMLCAIETDKKKKKKKKNRTESEMSDKSDNVLSCTLASQNKSAEDTSKLEQPNIEIQTVEPLIELDTEKSDNSIMGAIQTDKKKKNKKKNRNDSERSDKSDTIKSCTSGLKNMTPEDVSKLGETNSAAGDKKPTTELDPHKNENIVLSTIESNVVEKVKDVTTGSQEEAPKRENKNKKKNKKDNNQHQKESTEGTNLGICLPIQDTPTIPLLSEPKQHIAESAQTSTETQKEKELSPKPKAKVAKPVGKKQKSKLESESSENLSNIASSNKQIESFVKVESSKDLQPMLTDAFVVESQVEDQTKQQLTSIPSSVENINVPSDHAMGKKRKKSPKPFTNKETSVKLEVDAMLKTETKEESKVKDLAQTVIDLQAEIQPASSDSSKLRIKTPDLIHEEKLELIPLERPHTPEIKKDNDGFETKTSKKKKKTPKLPPEITIEVNKPVLETIETGDQKITSEENIVSTEEQLSRTHLPEPIPTATLETQNVPAEPDVKLDIAPDVYVVRSSSQHLFDTNNNTVIQEVINLDESKSNNPLIIPLIEGSGSTPVLTPEPVSTLGSVSFGITMTEIETKTPTEEKTDIKSKMMEVNQDMEELRLSIERSLAEFTALEKCKPEPEETSKLTLDKENILYKDTLRKDHGSKQQEIEKITPKVKQNTPEIAELKDVDQVDLVATEERPKSAEIPPICPARKDNKSKNKSKKKGKQESNTASTTSPVLTSTASTESSKSQSKDNKKEENKEKSENKSEKTSEPSQEKGKQQSSAVNDSDDAVNSKDDKEKNASNSELVAGSADQVDFEAIENFEDALTSIIDDRDDVNKTFEMIAKDADNDNIEFQKKLGANKPEINITTAEETERNRNEKINPVSQPKNLLGHIDIPVQSNKTDYKKEKNKTPNARQARVKIKDSMEIESKKQSKESQTENKRSRKIADKSVKESFSRVKNDNEEYVYKYSFRKVFLQSACHICNKDLSQIRVPCGYCNLVFYCGAKHKDEDWPQHQALCFAVSTLAHMKDQKHIYADAAHITGQDYRLLRMQMIVSCEKVLKRRLVPWEQELMLYPRICAEVACREWRQGKLKDCDGCGQLSYCSAHPEHLPKVHSRWCKSYSLYQKLVTYQQTKGRLEPRLPTKVMAEDNMPAKMNEVLAAMYEEKIDMNDIQYAALTQLATAPLTTSYCLQLCRTATGITNGVHKHPFTIHVVGAELQFEADALSKWETFFLHLQPDVDELRVVLVSPQLNPGHLPLDLLSRIKLCDSCQQNKRRVIFKFEDNKNYFEYRTSEDFINPDIICAFNPSIQRSSIYNGKDPWPASINAILKLKTPFIITSYTLNELRKDIARIKQVSELDFKLISEPGFNNFASVRPDRNFISDDEMPLLFKNYCVSVILGC